MEKKNDVLCKIIADKVENNSKRIESNNRRLDRLERSEAENATKINHLIEKIDDLKNTIAWFTRTIVVIAIGFIIWYIQAL